MTRKVSKKRKTHAQTYNKGFDDGHAKGLKEGKLQVVSENENYGAEKFKIGFHEGRMAERKLLDTELDIKIAQVRTELIEMLLWCPSCGARHVDEGEFATKPHHTHACQTCGMCWRPSVRYTCGVQFLPGFKNVSPIEPDVTPTETDFNS